MFTTLRQDVVKLKSVVKVFQGYYGLGIALVFFSLIGGILEGVGITALIPLFSFVDNSQQGTDFLSGAIGTALKFVGLPYTLKTFLIFIALIFIAKAVVLTLTTYLTAFISASFEERTRNRLMEQTLQADWQYLSKQKMGHLDQLLTTNINFSSALLTNFLSTASLVVNLIVYTLLVMNISVIIAAFTFVFGVFIFVLFKPFFQKGRVTSYKVSLMWKNLAHTVNENIVGMKTIKSLAVEKAVALRTKDFFEQIKIFNIRIAWFKNITNVLLQPAGLLFVLAIFSYFYKRSLFTFASFAVIIYAINKIFSYIQQLQNQFHTVNANLPYLTGLLRYSDEISAQEEKRLGDKVFLFNKELVFDHVSFSYLPEKKIVSDISFKIKKGEMVGIAGPSGSGKTTVVDLFLQLYLPSHGQISIDGVPISEIEIANWRKSVGYVSQDLFLMNETIENNIKFYDVNISQAKMIEAAKTAHIYDTIMALPKGFDTIIGERGISLSGGQRQRITLARVLARQPKILILDEATSALDNESEALIQKSIENLRGEVTIIAIAHRLTTILNFDRVLVLEDGKIVETGKPKELLEDKNSYFHRVYFLKK